MLISLFPENVSSERDITAIFTQQRAAHIKGTLQLQEYCGVFWSLNYVKSIICN